MELNWSTFILEIINFLILLWILKHFFYKPILNIIARRQAGIEKNLADAKSLHITAEALQSQYNNRLVIWEQEKQSAHLALNEEVEVARIQQMAALQTSLEKEREKRLIIEQHQQETERLQIERSALTQGAQFATQLLSATASPELERDLCHLLLKELETLPPEQLSTLQAASNKTVDKIKITSAHPLDDSMRQALEQSLSALLITPGSFHYTQDSALLAGLRINIGAWVLHTNLQDELKGFVDITHGA